MFYGVNFNLILLIFELNLSRAFFTKSNDLNLCHPFVKSFYNNKDNLGTILRIFTEKYSIWLEIQVKEFYFKHIIGIIRMLKWGPTAIQLDTPDFTGNCFNKIGNLSRKTAKN